MSINLKIRNYSFQLTLFFNTFAGIPVIITLLLLKIPEIKSLAPATLLKEIHDPYQMVTPSPIHTESLIYTSFSELILVSLFSSKVL